MVINNAGIVTGHSLLDLSEQDILATFGVNTVAHFWTIKEFLPFMLKAKRGHIVNVGSILGQVGVNMMSEFSRAIDSFFTLSF